MFDLKRAAQDLENMLHDAIVKQGVFTSIKGGSIIYKNYLIIKNKSGHWLVLEIKNKQKYFVSEVILKVSAFAICKLHEKHQVNKLNEVEKLDKLFEKNYIDTLFYRNTAEKSKNPDSKETAQIRYEESLTRARGYKHQIDAIFYSSIV